MARTGLGEWGTPSDIENPTPRATVVLGETGSADDDPRYLPNIATW